MADVRSMLRAERANRRITHPNASYTSDGKLLCNLCSTMIKSEAAWGSHLHSTQHTIRSSRVEESTTERGNAGEVIGKKRKANEGSDSPSRDEDNRKRARGDIEGDDDDAQEREQVKAQKVAKDQTAHTAPAVQPLDEASVVDDEMAAFEREIADLESKQDNDNPENRNTAAHAFLNSATVSAAPMTAEQVAAQAREELSTQRGQRDAEIAAEKEDAARLLEDEFEEMEGLEERVRRMRERREALRKGSVETGVGKEIEEEEKPSKIGGEAVHDEEDDEDDEEDFDDWGFGGAD